MLISLLSDQLNALTHRCNVRQTIQVWTRFIKLFFCLNGLHQYHIELQTVYNTSSNQYMLSVLSLVLSNPCLSHCRGILPSGQPWRRGQTHKDKIKIGSAYADSAHQRHRLASPPRPAPQTPRRRTGPPPPRRSTSRRPRRPSAWASRSAPPPSQLPLLLPPVTPRRMPPPPPQPPPQPPPLTSPRPYTILAGRTAAAAAPAAAASGPAATPRRPPPAVTS
jgi:hypothetical protein